MKVINNQVFHHMKKDYITNFWPKLHFTLRKKNHPTHRKICCVGTEVGLYLPFSSRAMMLSMLSSSVSVIFNLDNNRGM